MEKVDEGERLIYLNGQTVLRMKPINNEEAWKDLE